jgi:DNA-binding LacI/PurR family transcriptional regulator
MGQVAAETVLRAITSPTTRQSRIITVEPELVVRDSTCAAATPHHSDSSVSRMTR